MLPIYRLSFCSARLLSTGRLHNKKSTRRNRIKLAIIQTAPATVAITESIITTATMTTAPVIAAIMEPIITMGKVAATTGKGMAMVVGTEIMEAETAEVVVMGMAVMGILTATF